MSDPEGFLTRWSRRKRESADEPEPEAEEAAPLPIPPPLATELGSTRVRSPNDSAEVGNIQLRLEGREGAFDPATLPPVDSITADTDLRAFFAPGVPADLLHAALRRAWTSDPKIRDFVGLSENAWDFNAGTIPGFSSFEPAGEIGRAVAQSIGEAGRTFEPTKAPPAEVSEQPPASARLSDPASEANRINETVAQPDQDQKADGTSIEATSNVPTKLPKVDVALQHKSDAGQYVAMPQRRSHGRALPE